MKAIHLRTEYMENPVGIDVVNPRLFWICEGGKKQTAYQIIARCGGEAVWDTGKVVSSRMTHIPYEGKPLQSRQRIYWNVKLWDEKDQVGEISTAFFEMGLLQEQDWKAAWITGNYKVNRKMRYPVDCFKKHLLHRTFNLHGSMLPHADCMKVALTGKNWYGGADTRAYQQQKAGSVPDL